MKIMKLISKHRILNRYTALLLSVLMLCSVFGGVIGTMVGAEEFQGVSATNSHVVFADDFNGTELDTAKWGWAGEIERPQYTAELVDGKLKLNAADAGTSGVAGLRYVKDAKHIEQRVSVEFVSKIGLKSQLWLRMDQPNPAKYSTVNGYYVLFNCGSGGRTEVMIKKRTASGATVDLGKGTFYATDGVTYRLELVAQGTAPTLLTAYVYKVTGAGEQVATLASAVDSEEGLQDAGYAGLSYLKSSITTEPSVIVDNFEYTTTDNVTGKYYVEEGTTGSKTFGQLVALDPNKKYILTAYAKDNGVRNGEDVNPLWIEYFNSSNSYTRVLTARSALKSTRSYEAAVDAGVDYSEYFTVFYDEFNLASCANKKVESDLGGKTRVIVGFRTDGSTVTAGMFTHFTLYAADDPQRTNLLVNPDFKMGLYGWYDLAGSYMNYTHYKESEGVTVNGFAQFHQISDEEYDELFKNKSYVKPEAPVKNYILKNKGTVNNAKVGQIVEVAAESEYIYSVYYKHVTQNGSKPSVWYMNNAGEFKAIEKFTYSIEDIAQSKVQYCFSTDISDIKVDGGNVTLLVGIDTGSMGAESYYYDFMLYDCTDAGKTNLIVNPKFRTGLKGWTADCHNYTAIDDETVLATADGCAELVELTEKDYFKRTELPDGKIAIHNNGEKEYGKVGNIVYLDPEKTYVYTVSYKYFDQKSCRPFLMYKGEKGSFVNYDPNAVALSITEDDDYYRTSIEFKVPAEAALENDGTAKMKIGYTTGNAGANVYYGDFLLYDKADSEKKNLLNNADMLSGLKGWSDGDNAITADNQYSIFGAELVVVSDDFFKKPTFDKLSGHWVIRNTGTVAYAKFGQIVELYPEKTYIYAVSYKYIDQKGSMPFMLYHDGKTFQNYTEYISETDDEKNYRKYYEFKVPAEAAVKANGKAKMKIGLTCGMEKADSYFGDFMLYEKDDANQTNLFTNADFALGLYGWTSHGYNDLPVTEYGVMKTIRGDVELIKVSENYFARPTYEKLTGNWVIHNTGKVAYSKFGQVVELDTKKTYIYEASYKYVKQNNSMPFMQFYDGKGYQNFTDYISVNQDTASYREICEFKVPDAAAVSANGTAKMKVGITCGALGADSYFGEFLLYEKGDASKTNLLINADFALGLYGWTSTGYNHRPIADYGLKTAIKGDIELVKVADNYFKRPPFERFTEEPMLHITGKANYAHPGQILELTPGETYYYSMYEKYFSQNGSKPLVFIKKNGKYEAIGKNLEVKSQDIKNCFSVYVFTVPKDVDVKANGKSEVNVGFTTGSMGADAYFYDMNCYAANDKSKTNLFVNPDFELGLYGWTASGYNYKPETEYGATVFRYRQEAELLPYDATFFVNDLNDEFYDDGDWASKFGNDYTMEEWLEKLGVSSQNKGEGNNSQKVDIDDDPTAQNNFLFIALLIAGAVLVIGAGVCVIVIVKKRKKS